MNLKSNSLICRTALWGAISFAIVSARGGVVYEMTNTEYAGGVAEPSQRSQVSVGSGNLKISWPDDGTREKGEMIYRSKAREMVMIDHQKKQYFVVDQKTLEELAAQLNQAMEMLKNVPPAQREMMEKMMKGRMPQMGAAERTVEVKKTSEHQVVNGFDAVKYEVFENEGKTREHWVADWAKVEGSQEVLDGFKSMSAFFNEMMDTFSSGPMAGIIGGKFRSNWMGQIESLDGFPVATKSYGENGQLQSESELTSVSKAELTAADFEVPQKYKQQKMNSR